MANLKEVAELAGVSIATASLALRGGGNIRESTRIRGKGEFGAESHSTLSGGERIAWPKTECQTASGYLRNGQIRGNYTLGKC
jgi:hypothetical protein